ncbi:hypothetical protein KV697_08955 [Sphingomonas sanguinis]|uniref:Uncharacterized protein n=1 Tax=Sphingomonas sanguinis TaxID=33051 RepID=A0ABU5LVE1_9SPHN|nr:hypothetical protein [Sphingomonas sanguinis]MDZ7283895.1 hypothetical protein [Sphingomonas sanguinis]QXT37375.1 hypothetical protein KV697_08955 [Sphingomonas sanguinis]
MLLALLIGMNDPMPSSCPLPFPVVADRATALTIAAAVIAAAPKTPLPRNVMGYTLATRHSSGSHSWEVIQTPISAVKGLRFLDGEGLSMEIAICDGAVSNIRFNRAPLKKLPKGRAR